MTKNIPQNIPNDQKIYHKIYQMTTKCTKWPENVPNGHQIYQHLPLQEPPKFTQMGFLV
jgi:hypothetical protein